jgi:sugar phosphate isomerase/epimerase
MQLGFVSAILPDLSLDEVLSFAADEGFACIELMCWPLGGAALRGRNARRCHDPK